jgi:hypothetical protein
MDIPPDHQSLDSAPNLGPLISCWEINNFKNCWYKSVRILEVLKLLFQQFLHFSCSQQDMSGPILGTLSNNRWLGVQMVDTDCSLVSWQIITLVSLVSCAVPSSVDLYKKKQLFCSHTFWKLSISHPTKLGLDIVTVTESVTQKWSGSANNFKCKYWHVMREKVKLYPLTPGSPLILLQMFSSPCPLSKV